MTKNDLAFLEKRTKKYDVVVGIDPDTKASGFAILFMESKEVQVETLSFPLLLDKLLDLGNYYCDDKTFVVIVEASWLKQSKNGNTHNWHLKEGDSLNAASAKGEGLARNQETGRKIVELCKHWNIDVIEKAPLVKTWSGSDRKITHEEIAYFIPNFPRQSNPETRDAALLCWDFAGFPIKVKVK